MPGQGVTRAIRIVSGAGERYAELAARRIDHCPASAALGVGLALGTTAPAGGRAFGGKRVPFGFNRDGFRGGGLSSSPRKGQNHDFALTGPRAAKQAAGTKTCSERPVEGGRGTDAARNAARTG